MKIKKLTLKNFMSFGNIEHVVQFDDDNLTLILGENRDAINRGADERNGTGKQTICSAISYALTDKPVGSVKKDNLVNNYNEKNMVVTLEFEKDGNTYTIIRGRKPSILKLLVNGVDSEPKELQQGEMHDTQKEIDKIIGMSHDLLNLILIMSAQDSPFLKQKAAFQRQVIEELLGITQLSQKADKLREYIKDVQKNIDQEEFKIKTVQDLNTKTLKQLENLEVLSSKWNKKHKETIDSLAVALEKLSFLDIDQELDAHQKNEKLNTLLQEYNTIFTQVSSKKKEISDLETKLSKEQKKLDIANVDKKCYACGQVIDENHSDMIDTVTNNITKFKSDLLILNDELRTLDSNLSSKENEILAMGEVPEPFYQNIKDAWEHNGNLSNIANELQKELDTQNPYDDQISILKSEQVMKIDEQSIKKLKDEKAHCDFLLKTLTAKDSFVRKRIIDQSLSFLNFRLNHYINEIGLPHEVKFNSDLSVTIERHGKDYDFDNLSRGQKTRLNLALNYAFRDVFENLHFPVNLIMVDELLDNGLDYAGVDSAVRILKDYSREQKKQVFLIQHREEVRQKVNNVLTVVLENGFSTIEA